MKTPCKICNNTGNITRTVRGSWYTEHCPRCNDASTQDAKAFAEEVAEVSMMLNNCKRLVAGGRNQQQGVRQLMEVQREVNDLVATYRKKHANTRSIITDIVKD